MFTRHTIKQTQSMHWPFKYHQKLCHNPSFCKYRKKNIWVLPLTSGFLFRTPWKKSQGPLWCSYRAMRHISVNWTLRFSPYFTVGCWPNLFLTQRCTQRQANFKDCLKEDGEELSWAYSHKALENLIKLIKIPFFLKTRERELKFQGLRSNRKLGSPSPGWDDGVEWAALSTHEHGCSVVPPLGYLLGVILAATLNGQGNRRECCCQITSVCLAPWAEFI